MTAAAVDLSIVIVSHGHGGWIRRYLPTLYSPPVGPLIEVLLIHNVPDPATAEWAQAAVPQVRQVVNAVPRSFAANVNAGARLANSGQFLVVSNPDIRYAPGCFDAAIAALRSDPSIGVVGPELRNPDLSHQPSCRRFSTPVVNALRAVRCDWVRPVRRYLMEDMPTEEATDVDWVTGAVMIIRREVMAALDGMDEQYAPAYSEDQDFCCRAWRAGWRVRWVPGRGLMHDHQRAGVRRPWGPMARAQLLNAVRMYRKFGWRLTRQVPS